MLDASNGITQLVRTLDTQREPKNHSPNVGQHRGPLNCGLPSGHPPTRPYWRVLVVEDEPAYREQVVNGLLDAGLGVAWFARGSEALEAVHRDSINFDLVIADQQGSDLTGLELARALQVESPCTHVLLSTPAERLPALRASTQAPVLAKPFNMKHVLETLDSLCGGSKRQILVADDDASIRRLVQQSLSAEDYDVVEAEDGLQVCEALQREEFQLLVVDLVMPAHEGLETIRSICRRRHKLKILAISGQRPEYLKAAGLLGADAVLKKPFSVADLRTVVSRLLKRDESSSD